MHQDGKIASTALRVQQFGTMGNVNRVIKHARASHTLIAHVKVGFSELYPERPKTSPIFSSAEKLGALKLNTWGTQFHSELDVDPHDIIITKHRISAFWGTDLEIILRANHIETLVICGVSTNYAVEHCARDAHDRDYNVIVLSDACQAASQEIHDASLNSLSRLASIKSVNDYIGMI